MTQHKIEVADESGYFHHRDEISHALNRPPVGDVKLNEMFNKAREHAIAVSSKNNYTTAEASEYDVNTVGNIVGIIGQAGIGKTTLSKMILADVVKDGLFEADYIFYFQFRDIFNYNNKENLLSFLAKPLMLDWVSDKQQRNAVLKSLSASNHVIIIMDGFDEANFCDFRTFSTVALCEEATPEMLIKNILVGNILPKSKKIVTSRPRQLLELSNRLRPQYIVNILGLTLQDQYLICRGICGDNAADYVFNYIQSIPQIASYCYVPVNCILVMHSILSIDALKFTPEKNQQILLSRQNKPKNITGVFVIVVGLFLTSPHVSSSEEFPLQKVATLAWEGFNKKKFYFDKKDLCNAGLIDKQENIFLVTVLAKNYFMSLLGGNSKTISYFAHLIIQEFFVALKLIFFTTLKDFTDLFLKPVRSSVSGEPELAIDLFDANWEMVSKFLFGLCNQQVEKCLTGLLETFNEKANFKLKILQKAVINNMLISADNDYFAKVLNVCIWAYELNDDQFAQTIAAYLRDKLIIKGKFLTSDIAPFLNVLRRRNEPLAIDTTEYETWFVGDSIFNFMEEITKVISEKITVSKIFC